MYVSSVLCLFTVFFIFFFFFFFFQAEDGIRDWSVTGVQTCALPISSPSQPRQAALLSSSTSSIFVELREHFGFRREPGCGPYKRVSWRTGPARPAPAKTSTFLSR